MTKSDELLATSVEVYEDLAGTLRMYALDKHGEPIRGLTSAAPYYKGGSHSVSSRSKILMCAMIYNEAVDQLEMRGDYSAASWSDTVGIGTLGTWYVYDKAHNHRVASTDGGHIDPGPVGLQFLGHAKAADERRSFGKVFATWAPSEDVPNAAPCVSINAAPVIAVNSMANAIANVAATSAAF